MPRIGRPVMALVAATVGCVAFDSNRAWAQQDVAGEFQRNARRAAPRDAFPVFHDPALVPASRATGVRDEDWVIGVAIGDEAKAYPIAVMGVHELGNDTCGGEPIAVSW